MPRCSAPDWCFFRDTYEPVEYYRQLKAAGITAAELVNDPARRAAARAAGLPVLSLSGGGMKQGLNRLANHETLLPDMTQKITTAGAEGIPMMVALSGGREELSDAEGIANCITALRQLAPVAEAVSGSKR